MQEKLRDVIEILLVSYYDPLYDRHIPKNEPYELAVSGDDPQEAARQIVDFISTDFHRQA